MGEPFHVPAVTWPVKLTAKLLVEPIPNPVPGLVEPTPIPPETMRELPGAVYVPAYDPKATPPTTSREFFGTVVPIPIRAPVLNKKSLAIHEELYRKVWPEVPEGRDPEPEQSPHE